ncbi:MAG: acyltransferase, partial [Coprobacillus sp.]
MIKYFKKINQESKLITKDLNNYKMLDIVKFIAAIMVICIHCSQIFPDDSINFFIKNIVCRIAVPFFFITSAYFIRRGSYKNTQYINQYLKSTGQSYLFWSLIFIPIGLDWIYQNIEIAGSLLPFALLYGVLHIGTYYHLWYIPALL